MKLLFSVNVKMTRCAVGLTPATDNGCVKEIRMTAKVNVGCCTFLKAHAVIQLHFHSVFLMDKCVGVMCNDFTYRTHLCILRKWAENYI